MLLPCSSRDPLPVATEIAETSRRAGKRSGSIGMPGAAIRTASIRMVMDSRANLTRGSTCRAGSEGERRVTVPSCPAAPPTLRFPRSVSSTGNPFRAGYGRSVTAARIEFGYRSRRSSSDGDRTHRRTCFVETSNARAAATSGTRSRYRTFRMLTLRPCPFTSGPDDVRPNPRALRDCSDTASRPLRNRHGSSRKSGDLHNTIPSRGRSDTRW